MTTTPRPGPTGDPDVDAVLADVVDCRDPTYGASDGAGDDDLAARLQALTAAHRRLADRLAAPEAAPQPQPGPPAA